MIRLFITYDPYLQSDSENNKRFEKNSLNSRQYYSQ